jgi:hypothetical protein
MFRKIQKTMGHAVAQLVEVLCFKPEAGLIPDGVIRIFY